MSKRTVYARYRDKNELFSAVLRDLIDRWLVPINQFQLGTHELEPMLMEIGHHLLVSALAPQVVSLHRIILGESERRPAFGQLANAEGRQPAIRAIAAALRRQASLLRVNDLERAAEQFISLVIDSDLRLASVWHRARPGRDRRTGPPGGWISFCTGCAAARAISTAMASSFETHRFAMLLWDEVSYQTLMVSSAASRVSNHEASGEVTVISSKTFRRRTVVR